jgi:hypothetical protein
MYEVLMAAIRPCRQEEGGCVQPPCAENGIHGGVGGRRGVIPYAPPDPGTTFRFIDYLPVF